MGSFLAKFRYARCGFFNLACFALLLETVCTNSELYLSLFSMLILWQVWKACNAFRFNLQTFSVDAIIH